jgi:hypothetical protein
MVKKKIPEIGHEILFSRAFSEIPPCPPLLKGARGDFPKIFVSK